MDAKDKPVVISAENYAKKSIFKYSILNPKIIGALTVVLLLVGGVGAGIYLNRTPQQTVTQATLTAADISLKPSEIDVQAGSNFTLDVFGNANENQITSVKLIIKYDPDTLDLLSIAPKQFLPRVIIAPSIASGSATVSLGTDGNSGISGSGILASLSFKVKDNSSGTTIISFDPGQTQVNLLGQPANPPSNLSSATIKITPVSSPSASITPTLSTNFDFNLDSQINSIDLSIIYSAWGTPITDTQKKADINGDGVVNGVDYSLFLPQMQK